jgi:hypothetical protein
MNKFDQGHHSNMSPSHLIMILVAILNAYLPIVFSKPNIG